MISFCTEQQAFDSAQRKHVIIIRRIVLHTTATQSTAPNPFWRDTPRLSSWRVCEECFGRVDDLSSSSLICKKSTTHGSTPLTVALCWSYALLFRSGSLFSGLDPGAVNAGCLKRQHGTKQASHPSKDPCMNTFVMTGQEIHLRRERLFEAPAKHEGCNSQAHLRMAFSLPLVRI